ncbi:hypothetical protein RJT34_16987 [Clitoria ternatea]|uniref:endo-polygalacturonase n=1 Tax=Clitoria ternatea TaxID=43366 RepID=A0AAN9J9D3_CLITE
MNLLVTSFHSTHTKGKGFNSVSRLPHSRFTRSKRIIYVTDYGARGDGFHNDAKAFQKAWKIACVRSGRIDVVFPRRKTFLLHPVDITGPCRSKISLIVSGTIVAPKDPAVWHGLDPRKWLFFHGVDYLSVDGGGKINGMGQEWWARSCKINSRYPCGPAPTAITFHKCKNLQVRNLKVLNSQKMHIAFTHCRRVVASNLQVLAPAFSPNTDGIHVSATKDIQIINNLIRTGDDCISIVKDSSHVRIRNIFCGPGHGISIGSLGNSKTWEKVHDVYVKGAYLHNTNNGVRIKTWQGGRGLVSKIKFQKILMANVSNPIIIDQYYCDSRQPCKNQTSAVKVKDVSFINIQGTSATEKAIKFSCSDAYPCERLYLEDIYLVPCFGGRTKSYCWRAHGSSQGYVNPRACFSNTNHLNTQKVWLDSFFTTNHFNTQKVWLDTYPNFVSYSIGEQKKCIEMP